MAEVCGYRSTCELVILMLTLVSDGIIIAVCTVQFSLLRKSRLRRATRQLESIEMYLFSLCVSDCLYGIIVLVQDSIALHDYLLLSDVQMWKLLNQLFDFLLISCALASNIHLLAIAIERVVAIAWPTKYPVIDGLMFRRCSIACMWVVNVLLTGAISSIQYLEIDIYTKMALTRKYYGGLFLFLCATVFIGYITLFTLIVRREREMRELLQLPASERRSQRNSYLSLLIGFSYVSLVLPFFVCLFRMSCHPVVSLMVTWSHAVNPLVYFIKYYMDGRRRSRTKRAQTFTTASSLPYSISMSSMPTTATICS